MIDCRNLMIRIDKGVFHFEYQMQRMVELLVGRSMRCFTRASHSPSLAVKVKCPNQ